MLGIDTYYHPTFHAGHSHIPYPKIYVTHMNNRLFAICAWREFKHGKYHPVQNTTSVQEREEMTGTYFR